MRFKDETGNQYGRLTVLSQGKRNDRIKWDCMCECGNIVTVAASDLRSGHTKSCGCLHDEVATKRIESFHGSGSLNQNWKGGITEKYQAIRNSNEYKEWRLMVFGRDSFICQDCGISGVYLEAHHIFSFSKWEEFRFDIDNGITLCQDCHDKYNKIGSYDHAT